jgi:ParB family transcriptional regulator, chromosome partitioning protein
MSKNPRKSIVASFGLLSADLEAAPAGNDAPAQSPQPPSSGRVGAGVIGAAHRAIDDIRSERDRLRAMLEAGGGAVQELDPRLIDPSPYPDRLADDDNASFEAFKRSIEEEGQKVPIQVRRHPSALERYQIVYGHRRWLAARALERPVRAIEVEISDLDLVVAQGIENAGRQDLTWIERALFASRMDDAGIKPRHIYAALSIEDAELARMRSVYRAIPADIIEAIGRAPKIGRPRWLDLAKIIASHDEGLATVREELASRARGGETSDERFQRILALVKQPQARSAKAGKAIVGNAGIPYANYRATAREIRIQADGSEGQEFLKFVEAELPTLAARFLGAKDHD